MEVGNSIKPLALNSIWLDVSSGEVQPWRISTTGSIQIGNNNGWWYAGDYYPYVTYRTVLAPAKIKLKLSEVERLREVARADEAVRATLQKFTAHIEIEVDF